MAKFRYLQIAVYSKQWSLNMLRLLDYLRNESFLHYVCVFYFTIAESLIPKQKCINKNGAYNHN